MAPVAAADQREPSLARGLSSNQLMDHFWGLASVKETDRVKSALALISIVHKSQTTHATNEQEKEGEEEESWCKDLEYTVKRLIRGLASPRSGARQGYSTALAELMRYVPIVTPSKILQSLDEHLNVSRGAKSRETKDAFFGQAFGLLAVVRSGSLLSAHEAMTQVATKLQTLSGAKSFLTEVCCEAITTMVLSAPATPLEEFVKPVVKAEDSTKTLTPFDISLALALESKGITLHTLPGLVTFPLSHPSNYEALSVVMSDDKGSTPQLPCWWRLLIDQVKTAELSTIKSFWDTMVENALFVENRATHERKSLGFIIFRQLIPCLTGSQISTVFTEYFMRVFITNLSSKKNYLHVSASLVLKSIKKSVVDNDDDSKVLAIVAQLTGAFGSMRFDSLTKTKTIENLVAELTLTGIHNHVSSLLAMFLTEGKTEESKDMTELQINSRRETVVEQLVALLRNHRVPKDEEWTMNCVKFLFFHGFCVGDKKVTMKNVFQPLQVPLSPALQKKCADRCFTAIFELATAKPYNDSTSTSTADSGSSNKDSASNKRGIVDGELRIAKISDFVESMRSKKGVTFITPIEGDVLALYTELKETVTKIRKVAAKRAGKGKGKASAEANNARKSQAQAFEVLLLHLSLGLFKGDSSDETVSRVQDLLRACSEIFGLTEKKPTKTPTKKNKSKSQNEADSDDEDDEASAEEPNPIEVLVEILMSFLSDSSSAFRSIATQVFEQVSGSLTLEALSLLLEVLSQEEMAMGPQTNENDGGDEDVDHDHEHDKRPNKMRKLENRANLDGMEVDGEDNASDEDSKDESDDDDDDNDDNDDDKDDDDDDDDDDNAEVDPKLREALEKTLGMENANDDDEDNESELSDWDDERMKAVDGAIAAQFLLSKNSQPANRKQREYATIHFKLRVLDLLDVYVRKQSTNPLVIETIVPMLEAINIAARTKGAEPLLQRLIGVFKNRLCGMRDYPSREELDTERTHAILENAFKVASNSPIAKEAELASLATLLLVRVLIGAKLSDDTTPTNNNGDLNLESVMKLYSNAFEDFMTNKKSKVRPAMFKQFCGRFPELAIALGPMFAKGLTSGMNVFRTNQALALLQYLLQQTKRSPRDATESSFLTETIANGTTVLVNACGDKPTAKVKYVRDVLKVVSTAATRLGSEGLKGTAATQTIALKAAVEELSTSAMAKSSPPVKTALAQLTKLLPDDVMVVAEPKTPKNKKTTAKKSKSTAKKSKQLPDDMEVVAEPKTPKNKETTAKKSKSTAKKSKQLPDDMEVVAEPKTPKNKETTAKKSKSTAKKSKQK